MRAAFGAALILAAAVSLGLASGCQQILDVPSDSIAIADAVRRTCQCTPLEIQQSDFVARCNAELDELVELAAEDDGAKAELLALGDRACNQCSQVEVCYAEIVTASADGEGCLASSECAGWACCQGKLVVEGAGADLRLDTVQNEPVCCAPSEVDSACLGCNSAADEIIAGEDPLVCAEAFTLLSAAVECFTGDDVLGCPACAFGEAGRHECFGCLYTRALSMGAASRCVAEVQDCEADVIDRPNIVEP